MQQDAAAVQHDAAAVQHGAAAVQQDGAAVQHDAAAVQHDAAAEFPCARSLSVQKADAAAALPCTRKGKGVQLEDDCAVGQGALREGGGWGVPRAAERMPQGGNRLAGAARPAAFLPTPQERTARACLLRQKPTAGMRVARPRTHGGVRRAAVRVASRVLRVACLLGVQIRHGGVEGPAGGGAAAGHEAPRRGGGPPPPPRQ